MALATELKEFHGGHVLAGLDVDDEVLESLLDGLAALHGFFTLALSG